MGRRNGRKSGLKRKRTFKRRKMARRRTNGVPRTFVLRSTNFPLGQRCFAKLSYTQQFQFAGDNTAPWALSSNFALNGLSSPPRDGTLDNRASKFLVNQFTNYQVIGMKYTITGVEIEQSGTTAAVDPLAVFFVPWTSGNEPGVSDQDQFGYMKQLPGFKYKLVNNRFARTWTKISGYISVNKMLGRDVTDDDGWIGSNSALGTLWNNPTNVINFRFGLISVNESAIPAGTLFQGTIRTVYYCRFFNPSVFGTE